MGLIEFINNYPLLVGGTIGVFLLAVFNELKIKESNICGLTPTEAVSGFSNPAVITIGLLFILSSAIQKTGLLEFLDRADFGGFAGL